MTRARSTGRGEALPDEGARGDGDAEGRPGELVGAAEGDAGGELGAVYDSRRREALANPEVAEEEAERLMASSPTADRAAEARAANPDNEEEEAERLLRQRASVGADERSADAVKKQG